MCIRLFCWQEAPFVHLINAFTCLLVGFTFHAVQACSMCCWQQGHASHRTPAADSVQTQ
jgi:hypothetical protein